MKTETFRIKSEQGIWVNVEIDIHENEEEDVYYIHPMKGTRQESLAGIFQGWSDGKEYDAAKLEQEIWRKI